MHIQGQEHNFSLMQRRNLIITRATELLADKMLQIASYHNLCGQMYQPESPVQRA